MQAVKIPKIFISVFSISCLLFFDQANACQCEYKKDASGKKIFSSEWNLTTNTGAISFEIESFFLNSSTSPGEYDLSKSQGHGIPELQNPNQCKVTFDGTMVYTNEKTYSKGPIKMKLSGKDCKQYVSEAAYKPVINLPVWKIISGTGESALSIRILRSAINECGKNGNLIQRSSDCLKANPKLSKRQAQGDDNFYPWTLVSFEQTLGSVWKDETSKIVWSAPSKLGIGAATAAEGSQMCNADLLLQQLPHTGHFEAAYARGLFNVYPIQANAGFITADDPELPVPTIFTVTNQGTVGGVDLGQAGHKYSFFCIKPL